MSKEHDIHLLRDVLALLHPDLLSGKRGHAGQKENEERQARMAAWIKKLQELVSDKDAPWDMDVVRKGSRSISILPGFISLLREFMLTLRWPQVLHILNCLAHMPEGTDWMVWKAGLTVLYTEPKVNCELIQQFFKQMYLLRELNVRDTVLEFVLYLLTQGLTQEATHVIQESHKIRRGVRMLKQTEHTQHLCGLLDAYQGMIFYVDWRQAIHGSTASQNMSESFYDLMQPTEGPSEDAIRQMAARALLALDLLPDKAGVWDIFLPKAIEIHEYYEEFERARQLLQKYRKRNPDNPNSHRFLYEFLQRNEQHFEYDSATVQKELTRCLQDVAKLDPANPLVLILCDRMADIGNGNALTFIFDLLDFDIWKDRPDGWNWLSDYLQKLLAIDTHASKTSVQVLERCWAIRKGWWPAYHFSTSALCGESTEARDLLLTKSVVATVLLGQGCEFCQGARGLMKKKRVQHLDQVLFSINLVLFCTGEAEPPIKKRKMCRR